MVQYRVVEQVPGPRHALSKVAIGWPPTLQLISGHTWSVGVTSSDKRHSTGPHAGEAGRLDLVGWWRMEILVHVITAVACLLVR